MMVGRVGMMGSSLGYGDKRVLQVVAKGVSGNPAKTVGVSAEYALNKNPNRNWIIRGHKILKPTRTQYASWGISAAGGAAGLAALKHEKKRRVVKLDDPNKRRRQAAGAVAGAGLTNLSQDVGGWVTRESIKVNERNIDSGKTAHPTTRNQRKKVMSAHRHKHGMTGGSMENAPQKAYRDYPKGMPGWRSRRFMGYKNHPAIAGGVLAAGTLTGAALAGRKPKQQVRKVATTMSDSEAKRIAARYDTRGPLPKGLSREQKMKAYEGRYIATGGRKAEKWKRRADAAEVHRNVGLAAATALGGAALVSHHPKLHRTGKTIRRLENGSLGGAVYGGASELYGEHARSRRASYASSPGGVAGSALSRMQAYTPEKKR